MPDTPTAAQLRQAAAIVEQIEALQAELDALLQGTTSPAASSPAAKAAKGGRKKGKRTMSAETRARMAEAQRRRWAALKGE